jgi:hypothetical protein
MGLLGFGQIAARFSLSFLDFGAWAQILLPDQWTKQSMFSLDEIGHFSLSALGGISHHLSACLWSLAFN